VARRDLHAEERSLPRPYANTEHVYPYAVILPDSPDHIIYLSAQDDVDRDLHRDLVQSQPFPESLPPLARHLTRFKPLLESKVRSHGERRPWWSLHRPQPEILRHDRGSGDWAD
jgi:hypothetical protein